MPIFILRRLAAGIVVIMAVSLVAFTLLYLGGGDIATKLLGESASDATVARKAAELGLDRPLLVRYGDWLSATMAGDLGQSWTTSLPVSDSVMTRLPVTLPIVGGACLISACIAILLGSFAARGGPFMDGLIQVASLIGIAVPAFLVALLLAIVFAIQLGWFRATGYTAPEVSVAGWLSSVTLPIAALTMAAIPAVTQQIRGSMIDAMSRDYVRTLQARGLPVRSVVYRHVLRNAASPALAVLAVQFVSLLGGAVIIEEIFSIPGLGQLTVQSATRGDIPVVMGLVMTFTVIVVIVNLVIDLAQAGLNPRVRQK